MLQLLVRSELYVTFTELFYVVFCKNYFTTALIVTIVQVFTSISFRVYEKDNNTSIMVDNIMELKGGI